MSIVAVIATDDASPSKSERSLESLDVGFTRIAGVELLTRQIRNLLAGGVDHVYVVRDGDKQLSDIRAFVEKETRLHNLALTVSSELPDIAKASTILRVPCDVLIGPGVVRHAKSVPAQEVDALRVQSDDLDAYCIRIEDKASIAAGKRAVFDNVTKKTSGWVSKNINSLLSKPVSKLVSEFPITPNMVTYANTLLGIASAVLIARGDYWGTLGGGALFQLSAAMDRVDGEIARSKYQASKNGAWVDTAGDNITYIAFVIGLTIGTYRRLQEPLVLYLGFGLLITMMTMLAVMYAYLIKVGGSGSLVAVTTSMESKLEGGQKPWMYRSLDKIRFAGKRDFFSLAGFVICAFDLLLVAFGCAIAVVVGTIAYFLSAAIRVTLLKKTQS